ncbi:Protein of unknown function (DUF2423) [Teratosphaeria destructans]|uniref:DUF2423 domain-containing protein n=1 Tax=Teratosphaeria destructans TaxID=418781 RepID=A0A9W7SLL7_9PEZI|nr:Protein of unknown function (DUF2423) [Teratosphaeria destructans]
MAKSGRASRIKKNNQNLKKKVFGPVENARHERLNAKLMALINQPKAEMEAEHEDTAKEAGAEANAEDETMEVDQATKKPKTGNGFRLERNEKQKRNKANRIQKSTRRKKPRNQILFSKIGKPKSKKR